MKENVNENVLSELVDGELNCDQTNEVLMSVLDDEQARESLKNHLRLREAYQPWRNQQLPQSVSVITQDSPEPRRGAGQWRLGGLAAAAVIGGLLVTIGFWAASHMGRVPVVVAHPSQRAVMPEQMRQVASVFALHESVAGPLKWYAADDQKIQLASARQSQTSQKPVAVLFRLGPVGAESAQMRSYVIVCRDKESATIEFPQSNGSSMVRVHLLPDLRDGKVNIRYAITVGGPEQDRETSAALSGQRLVDLRHTSLGQLALADELVNVDASAWVIPEEPK
jgi:hypothetical protein